jgi:rhamnose transport system substrate-binding protein
MIRKSIVAFAVVASLAALAATVLARPSGAAHRKYTIADLGYGKPAARFGREEAKRLGVRILAPRCEPCSPQRVVSLYESMIARHVDAIVTDGYDPTLRPIFRKVRKAGILLVSSADDIAGERDLHVGYSGPAVYGAALADALASQIGKSGEYAILGEQGQYPIAGTWEKVVAAYVQKAYPEMKPDGVLTETGAGDENEVDSVKRFMAGHPNLKGVIGAVPTEAYVAADAITQSGRIGQVFSAGNGGDSLDPQLRGYVTSGAAELVYVDDPTKLGYLTVWATDYLLTGRHFKSGTYQVGGPIGRVWYYPKQRELRLDQPLTITKANLAQYANKF